MKYYIAYKYTGLDKKRVKDDLLVIDEYLKKDGHSTYIFFRDVNKWGDIKIRTEDVIKTGFIALENCDNLLVYINHEDKSEGMLLEIGYAKALGKKIVLMIKKELKYDLVRSLADEILEFDNLAIFKERE